MHLGLRQLLITSLIVLVLCSKVNAQEGALPTEGSPAQPLSSPSGYPYSQLVEDDWKKNNPLIPYSERRSTWGGTVSVGYSNYSPANYDPDFTTSDNYETFYGEVDSPMLEATFSAKLNFGFMSLAGELGGGYLENKGKFGASLSVIPVRVGATIALDGIFSEPYLVPYVGGGGYIVIYKEALASQSVQGNTTIAPYFSGGLRLQLDWIDPTADDQSLVEIGLENTYLYGEARYFAVNNDLATDFSTTDEAEVMINAGLMLEF